jgi:phosphoribosylformylglycinamidine cyclo-ligase
MTRRGLDYRSAGVDLAAAESAKSRIKALVESTFTQGTRGGFGGFGGMFRLSDDLRQPVLVSSADGVGTKVKVAIEAARHDTIGHDLVNHCVNDILVQGATPLFFLDYLAFGALEPSVVEAVVSGVARGCRENGCALLGGETAEMPGVYTPPDYDLAGFIVGVVEEESIVDSSRVVRDDVILGLESSGLHTNGYSLARRIVSERLALAAGDPFPGEDASAADVLLRVHRSYLDVLRPVLPVVHGLAHITGGGLPGNVDRSLPEDMDAVIDRGTWAIPNLFQVLADAGGVAEAEMFRTFNMGIGMAVILDAADADLVSRRADEQGIGCWRIGQVVSGQKRVILQ